MASETIANDRYARFNGSCLVDYGNRHGKHLNGSVMENNTGSNPGEPPAKSAF